MAAIDSGPPVSAMASKGAIRTGADASPPDNCTTDQQAGGTVEGES